MKTPTTLIIMDGFGLEGPSAGNAVVNAPTPNLDRIFRDFPGCRLSASGLDVGLPEGQMGNSEVGGPSTLRLVAVIWPLLEQGLADAGHDHRLRCRRR